MNRNKSFTYKQYELEDIERLTLDERLDLIRQIGKDAEIEFKKKYKEINEWFTGDYDQLYLLSYCMRYFLMNEEGYDEELENGKLFFAPHFIEILQAISLSHKRVLSDKPLWNDAEKLRNSMREIGTLIQTKLMNLPEEVQSKKAFKAHRIRTDMMSYHLAVRNWAYTHQMEKVAKDMALAIRQDFLKVHKIDPLLIIELLFELCLETEKRVNEHIQRIHRALSKKDYIEIQKKYSQEFETINSSNEDMEKMWRMANEELVNLRILLLAHSDLRLNELFTYSVNDLKHLSNNRIDTSTLTVIFDKLSLCFGELKDYPQEHIILDNPVHNKPFIKIDNENYFTSLWTIIPHLTITLLENFSLENDILQEKYNIKRAQYLEDEIETLFIKSFPKASIYRGSLYGENFENDLLVIVDSFALVIEAKSGVITKPAKRGAPKRLFNTIRDLVEAPSNQALRFIKFLKKNKGENIFKTKKGSNNVIDTNKIKYFIPLGITFYHLGAIGTNLKLLIDAGITNKQIYDLAPSVSLTDLQVIFETLDSDAQKIHYLHRRRELETQLDYFADELDLLGFYLTNGFNLGDLDNESNLAIDASLSSKILDPYFISLNTSKVNEKPSLSLTKWWKEILSKLEQRGAQRWIELSYILLNLNQSAQEELEKGFRELVDKIKSNKVDQKHNWVIFKSANDKRCYVVVAYPYLNEHREERDEMMQTIINMAFNDFPHIKGVAVIGVNIDEAHYPYSVIAGDIHENLFDEHFVSMSN